ncbi:hypothetical protein HPB48_017858 [Haemaphysalis longicornis]|uniref:Uncharacterized protein n=1 Tax=Haemaphysalis longicornis TaxID=44386 RepID=A0A9J6GB73_HAELO|nr:hypothetical protein HPB48_017858 [Haemaphysalis longicornis]
MQHSEMGTLPQTIMLAVREPYVITPKVDVRDGLMNVADGSLKVIDYAEGDSNVQQTVVQVPRTEHGMVHTHQSDRA